MSDLIEDDTTADGFRLTGWHVLAILLVFFGVMFAVNGFFLYSAIRSFPGEAVEKSYVQGLEYNQTLAQREQQAALGWRAGIGVVETGAENQLVAVLQTDDGAALSQLDVTARLRRPASNRGAVMLGLALTGAGEYSHDLTGLEPGAWEVELTAFRPGEQVPVFTARKDILVR